MDPSTTPSPTPEPASGAPPTKENVQAEIAGLRADLAGEKYDQAADAPDRVAALARYKALLTQRAALEAAATPEAAPTPPPDPSLPLPPLPPGGEYSPADKLVVQEFARVAPSLDIAPAEASELLTYIVSQLTAEPPDQDVSEATLKREWGKDYARNLAAAQLAFSILPASVRAALARDGFDNDVTVIRRLAKAGAGRLGAQEEMARMRADATHPLNNAMHLDHGTAVARYTALTRQAYATNVKTDTAPGHVRR